MNVRKYPTYFKAGNIWNLEASSLNKLKVSGLWSARISTGVFGLTTCNSGNRGPKDYGEILLASGFEGINYLVNLGFIPCPICKPEEIESFFPSIHYSLWKKYGLKNLEDFCDKEKFPFDARRLDWEKIIPLFNKTPSRIYLPKGLKKSDLIDFKTRIKNIGYELPPVGYYDPNIEGHFNEYKI